MTTADLSLLMEDDRQTGSTFFANVTLMCAWIIMLFVFYLPDRDAVISIGGMDLLATGKALSRVGSLGLLLALNLMMTRQVQIRVIFFYMGGFFVFLAWSLLSVTWSALPTISSGQVLSLSVMMVLGATIARIVETNDDARIVLTHLSMILLLRAVIMVICWSMTGGVGVSREENSFFHSTDAAETSTLGMLVLTVAHLGFPTRVSRLLYFPGILVFLATFIIAQNRLSLVITPPLLLATMLMNGNRKAILVLCFLGCVAVPAYMLCDPGLENVSRALGQTEEFAMRSGGDETVSTLSGRTELWEAIWEHYVQSPIIGLGYFVTSTTGELNVWGATHNYTAHNQLFQVLATTGIIGLAIFLLAMVIPARLLLSKAIENSSAGRAARSLGVIFLWLIMWGFLNSSFNGPIGSSSVVFWCIIGVTIGRLRQND
ncbi:MAG: O-antigen ligase family protein [Mariniblastus sp.]